MNESTITDVRICLSKIGKENFLKLLLDIEAGMTKAEACRKYGLPPSYLSRALRHIPVYTVFRIPTCLIGSEQDKTVGDFSETKVRPAAPTHLRDAIPAADPETMQVYCEQFDESCEDTAVLLADFSKRAAYYAYKAEQEYGVRLNVSEPASNQPN